MAKAAKSAAGGVLENAFQAYRNGDFATARKLSQSVLAGAPSEVPAKLAKALFVAGESPDAKAFAEEIVRRTRAPAKAYGFVGLVAFLFVVLLLIAQRYN